MQRIIASSALCVHWYKRPKMRNACEQHNESVIASGTCESYSGLTYLLWGDLDGWHNEHIYILGVWHVELRKVINIDISVIKLLVLVTDVFGEPHRTAMAWLGYSNVQISVYFRSTRRWRYPSLWGSRRRTGQSRWRQIQWDARAGRVLRRTSRQCWRSLSNRRSPSMSYTSSPDSHRHKHRRLVNQLTPTRHNYTLCSIKMCTFLFLQ